MPKKMFLEACPLPGMLVEANGFVIVDKSEWQ